MQRTSVRTTENSDKIRSGHLVNSSPHRYQHINLLYSARLLALCLHCTDCTVCIAVDTHTHTYTAVLVRR